MADSVPEHLREAADRRLRELVETFPLGYVPKLVWRGYRVTAGLAYYGRGVIGLSWKVLKDEASVLSTLTHEYAHLLAVARHGSAGAGHGPAWRQAMMDLGQEVKVHHNYEVERNVSRQKVHYVCRKCGANIQRSRRLPSRRKYLHVGCGGEIRLLKVERITTPKPET